MIISSSERGESCEMASSRIEFQSNAKSSSIRSELSSSVGFCQKISLKKQNYKEIK